MTDFEVHEIGTAERLRMLQKERLVQDCARIIKEWRYSGSLAQCERLARDIVERAVLGERAMELEG